jgi:hypothetical protein
MYDKSALTEPMRVIARNIRARARPIIVLTAQHINKCIISKTRSILVIYDYYYHHCVCVLYIFY